MIFGKLKNIPGNVGQATKIYGIQKQLEKNEAFVEEGNVKVTVKGGGIMPKFEVKSLEIDGQENRPLIEAINKALKKAFDSNVKKLQDMSDDLKGMMG